MNFTYFAWHLNRPNRWNFHKCFYPIENFNSAIHMLLSSFQFPMKFSYRDTWTFSGPGSILWIVIVTGFDNSCNFQVIVFSFSYCLLIFYFSSDFNYDYSYRCLNVPSPQIYWASYIQFIQVMLSALPLVNTTHDSFSQVCQAERQNRMGLVQNDHSPFHM